MKQKRADHLLLTTAQGRNRKSTDTNYETLKALYYNINSDGDDKAVKVSYQKVSRFILLALYRIYNRVGNFG